MPPVVSLPQLRPVPAQQATAVAALTGDVREPAAAVPQQPCQPTDTPLLVQSPASAASDAVTHHVKGLDLPPIPGPSTQISWSPLKGQAALLKGRKAAIVRPEKQPHAAGRVPRDRANTAMPGWNNDFSIRYEEPLSIKDQERALRHAAQGHVKPPHASAATREQGSSVVKSKHTSASPSSWPILSNFTQQPAALQNRPRQLASASCHHTKAATQSHSVAGAHMGSAVVEPRGCEQSKGRGCSNKLRGGSIAYSRNLDSAQSPLRPAKELISDGEAALCKLNKFCFLPFQVCCKYNGNMSCGDTAVFMISCKHDHCHQGGHSVSTLTSCNSSLETS